MPGSRDAQPGDVRWYEIRLAGRLEPRWAAWFDGLDLTTEPAGTTTLRGPLVDQSALHGVLQRVRDIGLPLISVTWVDPEQPTVAVQPAIHGAADQSAATAPPAVIATPPAPGSRHQPTPRAAVDLSATTPDPIGRPHRP